MTAKVNGLKTGSGTAGETLVKTKTAPMLCPRHSEIHQDRDHEGQGNGGIPPWLKANNMSEDHYEGR